MNHYDTYVLFVVLALFSFAAGQVVSDHLASLLLNLAGGVCLGNVLGGLVAFVEMDVVSRDN